ncbi:MAG TPA: LacI family DNA-binding transcriptional regulator, partial [Spirochaetia bacterium]
MPVTIYDIAAKAGVSVVTVSRVINGHTTVRESNRHKVREAMRELDYRPNAAARSLARGSTGMVGLVLPSIADAFMSQVVSSVETRLREAGLFLVVAIADEGSGDPDTSSMRLVTEERVDGVLVLSPVKRVDYILELKKRRFPFVLLDQHTTELAVPTISVDNYDGGLQATRALVNGGARRVAHVTGPAGFESSRERERGYRAAL